MANLNTNPDQIAKKAAGLKAAELVKDGMIIGLGTGSTAFYFIEALAERINKGLHIKAVATSSKSLLQAQNSGIPILDINTITTLDLAVDGADEIDLHKQMIKGGGGALFREKIIASMSQEMIVIVDESKRVEKLGKFPLPVEISPFGFKSIIAKIEALSLQGTLRKKSENEYYVTDNGNYIYDIHFKKFIDDPHKINHLLQEIVGVVETGLFLNMAGRVIVGFFDGSTEILH